MSNFPAKNITLPSLQVENLSLFYNKKPAFKGINMPIQGGKITALIGPSGCGKSSFLSCINRLVDMIPNTKTEGNIRLDGLLISGKKIDAIDLRRRIGTIFQKPNPFPFSIYKNLAFPLREHGIKDKNRIEYLIEKNLKNVGLWTEIKDRLNQSALSLSGGQKQRLCIARALILEPEVLLFDEPCSALDPISSGVVEDLIASLRDKYTVVIVTHNLAQAKRIGDYGALFWTENNIGTLAEFGTIDQIFNYPQSDITSAYIEGIRG
ncbi:phosphate ABC transporter ATP-binding protein [Cyanobacterium sp. IPPAS B-1200]|uniref:phosphate ABC transporter ATP-binding protein n=1 Tax=Cyanobacterium sp. IPPAS B-1200 TaxID=1562720 RepID=UPI00085259AA|nr:phosphate ABC transporter ATP-binding protein [Cyanobacterium sp. IPPAS B-1200]OEJ79465.1 phosphate ABC transporter ATP-binding protein [Cyanobacterium sp. IPPAS B-1200]